MVKCYMAVKSAAEILKVISNSAFFCFSYFGSENGNQASSLGE